MKTPSYHSLIQEAIEGTAVAAANPWHIECSMRETYGTLDGLSRSEFVKKARRDAKWLLSRTPEDMALIAESYGPSPYDRKKKKAGQS
jgi:hypothetical protein